MTRTNEGGSALPVHIRTEAPRTKSSILGIARTSFVVIKLCGVAAFKNEVVTSTRVVEPRRTDNRIMLADIVWKSADLASYSRAFGKVLSSMWCWLWPLPSVQRGES